MLLEESSYEPCVFESESDEGFSGRWIRAAAAGTLVIGQKWFKAVVCMCT